MTTSYPIYYSHMNPAVGTIIWRLTLYTDRPNAKITKADWDSLEIVSIKTHSSCDEETFVTTDNINVDGACMVWHSEKAYEFLQNHGANCIKSLVSQNLTRRDFMISLTGHIYEYECAGDWAKLLD